MATNTILNIAKRMSNLKSFIHISTLYAHCHDNSILIEERFYTYPNDHKDFITSMRALPKNDEKLSRMASLWPNTYTCTKAITEILLRDEGKNLPIGIFRPAMGKEFN
ncbi:Fatty acyl-CoA reductase [Camponotus japonicus]